MRMTRRRRKALAKREKRNNPVVAAQGSRLFLRRWRRKQQKRRWLRRSVACMSASSVGLISLLPCRSGSAGELQPWMQAGADMQEVSRRSHAYHEKMRLAKKRQENAKAQQQAEKQLAEAQQYLEHCRSELRIYETTSFHNELVKQRYAYWQQEKEKAAAAKERAELCLTDKQVEELEIERQLRQLQQESHIEAGMTYSSWSGERSGSQLAVPVEASWQKDNWSLQAKGGFVFQRESGQHDFSSLLDTEAEGRLTAYREGPRSLQYILGLHLPTGQTQNASEILPDGLGSLDYVHRGWEVTPGVEFSYHYTEQDVLKTRFDVSFPGDYHAPDLQGWQPEVHPGSRYRPSLTYLHTGGTSSYMLKAMCEAEEKAEMGNFRYRPGVRSFLGAYAEHYVSSRDAVQAYAASFRQQAGHYDMDFADFTGLETDGRFSGTIYGLGWRHEENPSLSYYARAGYMKMGGTRLEPARYLVQKDVRRWSGTIGMEHQLREDLRLGAELSYYNQKDGIQGDIHGWQSFVTLQKLF